MRQYQQPQFCFVEIGLWFLCLESVGDQSVSLISYDVCGTAESDAFNMLRVFELVFIVSIN